MVPCMLNTGGMNLRPSGYERQSSTAKLTTTGRRSLAALQFLGPYNTMTIIFQSKSRFLTTS